jgi:HTH-type transcriptional regulator, competence development regulator
MSNSEKTFGKTVREMRVKNTKYSLREVARILDVSASYLSDVENDRRTPPKEETIIKMANLLGVDSNLLLAVAQKMPPEFYDTFIKSDVYTRKVPEFLRRAKEKDITEEQWDKLIKEVDSLDSGDGK